MVYILRNWGDDPPALTKEQVKQIKTATRAIAYLRDGESYLQLAPACGHDYCDEHTVKIPCGVSLDDYSDYGATADGSVETHGIAAYSCNASPSSTYPEVNAQWGAFLHALRPGDMLSIRWTVGPLSQWAREHDIAEDRAAIGIRRDRPGAQMLRLDYALESRSGPIGGPRSWRMCRYDPSKEVHCQTPGCHAVIDATRNEDRCYSCRHPQSVTDGLAAAPVGFTSNGETYCATCYNARIRRATDEPISATEEFDSFVCEACGEPLTAASEGSVS